MSSIVGLKGLEPTIELINVRKLLQLLTKSQLYAVGILLIMNLKKQHKIYTSRLRAFFNLVLHI